MVTERRHLYLVLIFVCDLCDRRTATFSSPPKTSSLVNLAAMVIISFSSLFILLYKVLVSEKTLTVLAVDTDLHVSPLY